MQVSSSSWFTPKMSAAIASVALLALLLITGNRQALAEDKPKKVFAGQVFVSDKVFPNTEKSSAAYIAAVKKQKKTSFQEDIEAQSWKIYYAAFL